MTNEKEVKKLLRKFNKNPNAYLAYVLSRILGFEPDLDQKFGTYTPPASQEQIARNLKSNINELF